MSRCFPFPPPGYEKARNDYTDLLIKEKHKERKQKKDKKEKEKRDRKEKQDKDRSKEKHKDKRDRKERHKDKERDSYKDKNKTPDEKNLEVKPRNGEKLSSNDTDKNSLHLQELAKRIRDEDRASGSQMVVERSIKEDQRKVNGKNDTRGLEKTFGHQNLSGFDKRFDRVEAIVKPEEKKNVEKQVEAREKSKHKESDKLKELEKIKKSKDKDRGKEEEKKAKAKDIIEPSKDKLKLNEKVFKVHEGDKDSLDFRNIKSPPESINLSFASPAEANPGKRKELERNGYLLDNGSRLNKLPRNLSFKEPGVENGKKLQPCQTNIELTPEPRLDNHQVVVNKEKKINGSIPSHQPDIGSLKLPKAATPAKENGEKYSKAPHPDTRYLSQILSVPKMEEWCELDDQEWLFSGTNLQPKKLRIEGAQQVWAEAIPIECVDITARPYVIPY